MPLRTERRLSGSSKVFFIIFFILLHSTSFFGRLGAVEFQLLGKRRYLFVVLGVRV